MADMITLETGKTIADALLSKWIGVYKPLYCPEKKRRGSLVRRWMINILHGRPALRRTRSDFQSDP